MQIFKNPKFPKLLRGNQTLNNCFILVLLCLSINLERTLRNNKTHATAIQVLKQLVLYGLMFAVRDASFKCLRGFVIFAGFLTIFCFLQIILKSFPQIENQNSRQKIYDLANLNCQTGFFLIFIYL